MKKDERRRPIDHLVFNIQIQSKVDTSFEMVSITLEKK